MRLHSLFQFAPLALGLSLWCAAPMASSPALAAETAHPLQEAKKAFQGRDLAGLAAARRQLEGSPLATWADYWTIRVRTLSQSRDLGVVQQVFAFAEANPRHPLGNRLLLEWARSAMSATDDPLNDPLLARLPADLDSPGLRCQRGAGLASNDLLSAIREDQTHPACQALAAQSIRTGRLTDDQATQLARQVASLGRLDQARALWRARPSGAGLTEAEEDLLTLLDTARDQLLKAAQTLDARRVSLNTEQRRYAQAAIGARLWLRTDARAYDWLQAGQRSLSGQADDILEAAARLALRHEDWPLLDQAISAMRPSLQQSETWGYWRAVLAQKAGREEEARAGFEQVAKGFGFYSLLAEEALGRPHSLPLAAEIPAADWKAAQSRWARDLRLREVLTINEIGMRAEAAVEWQALLSEQPDLERLAAAQVAMDRGHPDRAIVAAASVKDLHRHELRFPTLHKAIVRSQIDELSTLGNRPLDPAWVLGLIRQESRFVQRISSSAGAQGLMQLMPATARLVARQEGLGPVNVAQLADPQLNIRLGTRYLHDLALQFNGSRILATAGYNAGPGRSRLWRTSLQNAVSGAAFTESIPFNETRTYVKSVGLNAIYYSILLEGAPVGDRLVGRQSLTDWLGRVGPQ